MELLRVSSSMFFLKSVSENTVIKPIDHSDQLAPSFFISPRICLGYSNANVFAIDVSSRFSSLDLSLEFNELLLSENDSYDEADSRRYFYIH